MVTEQKIEGRWKVMRCDVRKFADERKNRGMKNMDQTSNNQNESDEIKMSRGSVDANEGSLGSGKKKSRFGIGVLVGIVIGAVIITGVWGAAKVVSAVFFKGNFATESTSRSDMEHKLDRLNALIEKYYLYEDEIDKDALCRRYLFRVCRRAGRSVYRILR